MDSRRVREFMQKHANDEIVLIDVRQPEEYRQQHLPGATLIPLPELPERLAEIDPAKPTVVY